MMENLSSLEQRQGSVVTSTSQERKAECKLPSILKLLTVEPIFLMTTITYVMYKTISSQYIYNYFSKLYDLENTTQVNKCNSSSETNTTAQLQAKVTALSSDWVFYLNLANFIPSFFTAVILGAWGDAVGRKAPLLCSLFGFLVLVANYIIVTVLNLPVYALLPGTLLYGLSGGFVVVLSSCYSYFGDISSQTNRTVRVAAGEACSGIGGVIASLVAGIWIDSQGFVPSLLMLSGLLLVSILYVLFLLPESHCPSSTMTFWQRLRALFTCNRFSGMWSMMTESRERCWKFVGLLVCYFFSSTVFSGTFNTITLYELSPPLCWSATLVGYGTALFSFQFVSGMIIIRALKGVLSDFSLVLLGTVSAGVSLIVYGFATVTWMVFLGLGLALFQTVGVTVVRSLTSRFAKSNEQGVAFALVGCSDALANLVGSLTFNELYSSTVHYRPGTVFFVGAGIQPLFFVIFWFVFRKIKDELQAKRLEEYQNFIDPEESQ